MSGTTASGARRPSTTTSARRPKDARRETLLDAAAAMVTEGKADSVSMDAVASRAGVSRPLVYKHFANRDALLHALYERESAHLHARLGAAVEREGTLEGMLRALVSGALDAQAERGATFAALAAQGARPRRQRDVQRRRDAQTLRHFVACAVAELAIEEETATVALGLVLGSISVVLSQWRRHPTAAYAATLTETFVTMAMGGLRSLSAD